MPLSAKEAFGLFSTEVNNIGQRTEMLRVGLVGFQQALQENDQLREENEQLREQLKGAGIESKPASSVTPFPGPPGTPPPQGAPPPQPGQ